MRRKDNLDGSWTWTIPNPLKGGGSYRLRMWDTGTYDHLGKTRLGYHFLLPSSRKPLFADEDFACSPLYAIDSKDAAEGLLGFLTLRPGDADAEYFDSYDPQQLTWAQSYDCEALAASLAE